MKITMAVPEGTIICEACESEVYIDVYKIEMENITLYMCAACILKLKKGIITITENNIKSIEI